MSHVRPDNTEGGAAGQSDKAPSFMDLVDQTHSANVLDPDAPPVLSVDNLKMYFPVKSGSSASPAAASPRPDGSSPGSTRPRVGR
jgi:hypothetical protein